MEERARRAGYHISRSTISDYEHRKITTPPTDETARALAAALDVTYDEVVSAIRAQHYGGSQLCPEEERSSRRAQAWLRLTANRTDEEIQHLLSVVEQIIRFEDRRRSGPHSDRM